MDILSYTPFQRLLTIQKPIHKSGRSNHWNILSGKSNISVAFTELSNAHQLFDEIPIWDTFAWNSLIQTHLTEGRANHVVSTYQQMLLRGVRPDKHTLPRILAASLLSGDLNFGKQVHAHSFKLGFSSNLYVITALIELYGRLDSVDTAKSVFDRSPEKNSTSWTVLAKLYIMEGKPKKGIDLFYEMVKLRVEIDSVAFATTINACGSLKLLRDGRKIHVIAREFGLEFDVLVSNSLLKMYIDCGSMKDAREIFDCIPSKDVISWTEIIHAYVKQGGINESLKLFRKMNMEGLKPDALTISTILPACGRIAVHKNGKEIHGYVIRNRVELNLIVQNAIMDMYVKSGCIESASRIFATMKNKDAISWTVMILGYSLHGQGRLGVELFREIKKNPAMKIDQILYTAVLHACSNGCMVEDGKSYFKFINSPTLTHLSLRVALLARSGLMEEARVFIEEEEIDNHAEILRAMLDGCRIHGHRMAGRNFIERMCELEPLNAENYVMLSNWYAGNGKREMVEKWKETIKDMGLTPRKAYSWIEFRNKVHVFGTGDVSHPRSEEIYWRLQSLKEKMEGEGHLVDYDFSFHDVDEERECVGIGHSELLAISFGLISKEAGSVIRVTKNHNVCRNCHRFAELVSDIGGREIILKDPICFHHFKGGHCSCRNFS